MVDNYKLPPNRHQTAASNYKKMKSFLLVSLGEWIRLDQVL